MKKVPIRVLLIDEDEDTYRSILGLLSKTRRSEFTVEWLSDYDTALGTISQNHHDVCFAGYDLGKSSGLDLLRESSERGCETPIIMLTGRDDTHAATKAMEGGAVDYLVRGSFDGPSLESSIRRSIEHTKRMRSLQELCGIYRSALDTLPVSVAVLDKFGSIIALNESWRRNSKCLPLGWGLISIGSDYLDVLELTNGDCSNEAGALANGIRDVITSKRDNFGLKFHFENLGNRCCVKVNVTRLRNSDPARAVVVYEDNTEFSDVQKMVAELETKLMQAQKMESVGKLATGVAHDFNNLLTAIMGCSDLLLNQLGENEALKRRARTIKSAGEQAAWLTKELLAFSHDHAPVTKVMDLNKAVAAMEKMLPHVIGENIEIVASLAPELGKIKADPGLISQVIMNLAMNARDAMPTCGKLMMQTKNADLEDENSKERDGMNPGQYVVLSISDTGTGMNRETLSHVFESFSTTKEQGSGTGLGLSTVQKIVNQVGGKIKVASEVGHGTTFNIFFPRASMDNLTEKSSALMSTPTKGNETILLVEEEDLLRKLASEILQMNGYTVLEAHHGGEAIRISKQSQSQIHLMLTDLVMAQMNGDELAQVLEFQRPDMRVLYMSGYTDGDLVQRNILAEARTFLQKPFSIDELTFRVREVLNAS